MNYKNGFYFYNPKTKIYKVYSKPFKHTDGMLTKEVIMCNSCLNKKVCINFDPNDETAPIPCENWQLDFI
jgi:hypothetical protein